MATINRNDGIVIAWGGEVEGPIQELNRMGAPTGVFSFKAKLGVGDAELHEMIIHVPASVVVELGTDATPNRDALARQCVSWYVEQHCKHKWVPAREEHFTLNNDEMRQLRMAVLQQPKTKRFLCTVKLPLVNSREPEKEVVVEVNSSDNAVIMLKTRMNADPKYDWDSARVIECHEKP